MQMSQGTGTYCSFKFTTVLKKFLYRKACSFSRAENRKNFVSFFYQRRKICHSFNFLKLVQSKQNYVLLLKVCLASSFLGIVAGQAYSYNYSFSSDIYESIHYIPAYTHQCLGWHLCYGAPLHHVELVLLGVEAEQGLRPLLLPLLLVNLVHQIRVNLYQQRNGKHEGKKGLKSALFSTTTKNDNSPSEQGRQKNFDVYPHWLKFGSRSWIRIGPYSLFIRTGYRRGSRSRG